MSSKSMTRAFIFQGVDGTRVAVEETVEREEVVLSITRNGRVETARLDSLTFDAFTALRYEGMIKPIAEPEPEAIPAPEVLPA